MIRVNGLRRQEQRWDRQKKKIILAAGKMFRKKGYVATNIDDIANVADINKATIYYYFKNKAFILYEVVTAALQALLEKALPITSSNQTSRIKLEALIKNHVIWQASNPGLAGIGAVEKKNLPPNLRRKYIAMRDEYEAIFRKTIDEGIKQKEFSFRNAKLGCLFTLGVVSSVIQWYRPKGNLSIDEIASELSEYIFSGLKVIDVYKKN